MSKRSKRYSNRPISPGGAPLTRSEFNPDYSTVKRDLRRIGALAGFFFAVLIVLSFFLR